MKKQSVWWRPLLVGLAVGCLAAAGFGFGLLESWNARASDRLFLARAPDPSVAIIAIDDASIGQIGRWPWPRSVHAELIRTLIQDGAKVIGYDVNFPEVSDAANDDALASALRDAGNVVLPIELQMTIDKKYGAVYDAKLVLSSIAELGGAAKSSGHTNTPPDADGVVRRIPLAPAVIGHGGYRIPAFAEEVARLAGFGNNEGVAPSDQYGRVVVNYPGQPLRSFRVYSAVDVLRGRIDPSRLKGAVVFVGSTAADLHDALLTPTSNGVPMSGVEIHASFYDTLVGRHWLQDFSPMLTALLLIVLSLLMAFCVMFFRARWSLVAAFILWFLMLASGFLAFDRGLIVNLLWPTLTLAIAYAAVTLERRVTADLERRQLKSALSRYVSASVVKSLLDDPSKLKLGGERKRMSVLFSDIRGFTTISEGLSPEKLVVILNKYLTEMTRIVFEHEGVLDKYIGDAVMAFWNAPFDQPDHAFRAVSTALAMRETLADMNRKKVFGEIELKIGIGVNTGDMVVGNVGGEERFDYTVIGDNVNLGSRLESLTKEYKVSTLCTESTRTDLKDQVLVRRLDKVAVKGKKEPVVIYEVMELATKATVEQRDFASRFENALEKYFSKQFAESLKACEEILETSPDDGPANLLKERAEHFLAVHPPENWDGTWVYTKK